MRIDCVKRMLHNRRYLGEYIYHDTVQPGGIPAIVPQDLFDRVQVRHKLRELLVVVIRRFRDRN